MEIFNGLYAFIWRDYKENNCNTYLIDGEMKILIDPGHRHLFRHVQKKLAAMNIFPEQIHVAIVTHGHPDHLEAVTILDKETMFAMNNEEHQLLCDIAGNYFKIPEPNFFLQEGDLTIGDYHFQVFVTPGHSPGSICLYWPDKKAMFTGDVVFNQGIGRTDLPGGDSSKLKESIKRIASMDIEYLFTGHGEIIKGKDAVRSNFQYIENYWFRYL